jgi:precorrin-2 dehydrogenase / sirohydrochlorin ferrochelatase
MSSYPLMIEGTELSAVVIGGGSVATRKALALLRAGARVHVVAPAVSDAIEDAATRNERLHITRATYSVDRLGDALLVIAATDDPAINAEIARDAQGRLINVVTAPDLGNCITPAMHRAGDVVVAVSAGGVPTAAARIRDSIGKTVDARYAIAVSTLASLRRSLIDAGQQERWSEAVSALIGQDFCDAVESTDFNARIAEWR